MLQSLLPLLEGLAAEGGTLAGLGRGVGAASTAGGAEGIFSRLGLAKGFGSSGELGAGLQRASDLQKLIESANKAMEGNFGRDRELAAKQAEQERFRMLSDPALARERAALAAQNVAHRQAVQTHEREITGINNRLWSTDNPVAASFGRVGAVVGGAQALQAFGMGLPSQLPGVQAAQNVGGFLAGPKNAAIAGQMAQQLGATVTAPFTGAAQGAALGSLVGPAGAGVGAAVGALTGTATELSKLPKLLVDWGQALVDSKDHLRQFSPALAGAHAESRRREILRDMQSARTTGGVTADLSGTLQNIYDEIQPMRDSVTVVITRTTQGILDALHESIRATKQSADYLKFLPVIGQYIGTIEGVARLFADDRKKDAAQFPLETFLQNANRFSGERFKPKP